MTREIILTHGALVLTVITENAQPGVVTPRPMYELAGGDAIITLTEKTAVLMATRIMEKFIL